MKKKDTQNENLLRAFTKDILNYYNTETPINSRKKWEKKGNFQRNYKFHEQRENIVSKTIGYEIVYNELKTKSVFNPREFNLFPMECVWLDHSLMITKLMSGKNQPFIELGTEYIYGVNKPVVIRLYDPGIAATSMMNYLFRHVIIQRDRLIQTSCMIGNIEWYLNLRNLICDSVSLVDMTLNRLHYESENNPKPHWVVAPGIGQRNGVRLLDKIHWVHKCTGLTLPDISSERAALVRLKEFRNQFMHFDPPHFVFLFSNLSVLLNDIILSGQLIYKIRKTIGAKISEDLIAFLLQKEVNFIDQEKNTVGISF